MRAYYTHHSHTLTCHTRTHIGALMQGACVVSASGFKGEWHTWLSKLGLIWCLGYARRVTPRALASVHRMDSGSQPPEPNGVTNARQDPSCNPQTPQLQPFPSPSELLSICAALSLLATFVPNPGF